MPSTRSIPGRSSASGCLRVYPAGARVRGPRLAPELSARRHGAGELRFGIRYDLDDEFAQRADFRFDSIAPFQICLACEPHARGRSGVENIAGLDLHMLTQCGNELRYGPNHLTSVGILPQFSIHP